MLHVRLVVPAQLRVAVLARLEADDTVCSLVVLPDQARAPDGDLVLFDLPIESANDLLSDLKAHDLHRHGSITLHRLDATLSDHAERAEERAAGTPSEAVIWDEVAARVGMEARLTPSLAAFMVVAIMIGAIAVLIDSPVLVIGAMVVGPEFGPLAAAMLALYRRRWGDAARALRTVLAGFGLGAVAAGLMALALRATGQVPLGYLVGELPNTEFIVRPDLFSLLVALLAGVAGMLSLTEGRSGILVGVLISVTTIPAVGALAVGLALSRYDRAWGALAQLGLNVGCLLVVGLLTLSVQDRLLGRHGLPGPRTPQTRPTPGAPHHPDVR
ncbi:MAG: DUF389 domain-containing protein [Acidimicrobiales bacterium]